MGDLCEFCGRLVPEEEHKPDCVSEAAQDARRRRRRRWGVLAEDGAIFGLTVAESAELARLEAEFGSSPLPAEMRS